VGGSGGGGGSTASYQSGASRGGGGGGGAVLVCSPGTLTLGPEGVIAANGGAGGSRLDGPIGNGCGGGGSGGAIRLVAGHLAGHAVAANLQIGGGSRGAGQCGSAADGGNGRLRVEFDTHSLVTTIFPSASVSHPAAILVSDLPALAITSVGGVAVPALPQADYGAPDLALPGTAANPVAVQLAASGIPLGTTVTVTVTPEGGDRSSVDSSPLQGTQAGSTAIASVDLPVGSGRTVVLSAQADFTVQQAGLAVPAIDGERVAAIRVATSLGGATTLAYVTEGGREVPFAQAGVLPRRVQGGGE
jgi:hypothetical protein